MSKLTDSICKAAKDNGKVQKLRDGNGLYLHVMKSGKYWRYDYTYQDKRRTLSIGIYPSVTLKQARTALYNAKSELDEGIDPSYAKKLRKNVSSDLSFESVATEFFNIQNWSARHRRTIELRVQKDLIPKLGHISVTALGPRDFLHVFRVAESRGAIETAHRLKTISSQIMRYAVSVGHIPSDPCRDLKGALKTPRSKRFSAIVEPVEFGKLLRAIDTYDNNYLVALALQLAPHVVVRPGELRNARKSEFDLDNRLWSIPAERMKKNRDHFVPLTNQSIEIIGKAMEYSLDDDLLFPSVRSKGRAISDGTLNAALKYLGYDGTRHTPHGFRSSFSTMAYESDLFTEDVIEMQLAHLDKNAVKIAYKRGQHMEQRRELMSWWSDRLDAMRCSCS